MSETNQIRTVGQQDSIQPRRRAISLVADQRSFEEELLKIQFFDTQSEPVSATDPLLAELAPREVDHANETDRDEKSEDSGETNESSDDTGEYLYGVVPAQLVIEESPDDVELPLDANVEVEVETANQQPGDPEILRDSSIDGQAQVPAANLAQDTAQPSIVSNGEEVATEIRRDGPEVKLVGQKDVSIEEEVRPTNAPINDIPLAVRPKRNKESREQSKADEPLDAITRDAEEPRKHNPDVHGKKSTSFSDSEAPPPGADESEIGKSTKGNRRADRLEKNRLDTEREPNPVDSTFAPRTDDALKPLTSLDRSIETADVSSIPVEATTTSTSESASIPSVVTTPQATLAAAQASLSVPAGVAIKNPITAPTSTSQSTGAVTVTSNLSGSSSTSASRETTGSSRANLTPYQETKLVQRVLRGIEQLGNGGGQVKIRLHPPELGTLQMTLKFEATQVTAQFEVENRVARDALLGNSQVLKDRLKEQGLEVQKFEVDIRSDANDSLNSSSGDRSGRGDSSSGGRPRESRFAAMNGNRIRPDSVDLSTAPDRALAAAASRRGKLDLSA